MSPEEKAKKLVDKFSKKLDGFRSSDWRRERIAKQCAIICCDEIIEDHKNNAYLEDWKDNLIKYWQSVKTEIQGYE